MTWFPACAACSSSAPSCRTDMNLVDELFAITGALNTAGIRYAVCGGIAVTIHGVVRTVPMIRPRASATTQALKPVTSVQRRP